MSTYKQILSVLLGEFKTTSTIDYIINGFRVLYFIVLLPSIIFAFFLEIDCGFGEEKENIGIIKKVLFHLSMIGLSFIGWIIIFGIVAHFK